MPQNMNENRVQDAEIELIDYVRIIIKWKTWILVGTFIITAIVAVKSYTFPNDENKIYQSSLVVKLGIRGIDKKGRYDFIGTPSGTKMLIER
ncbi:MAG: hypothetical protein MI865_04875, partial [Proteobacteria bacterium]|nr:hypothetical protein [Pseudomonadota bacterium]